MGVSKQLFMAAALTLGLASINGCSETAKAPTKKEQTIIKKIKKDRVPKNLLHKTQSEKRTSLEHLTDFWKTALFETSESEKLYYDRRTFNIYGSINSRCPIKTSSNGKKRDYQCELEKLIKQLDLKKILDKGVVKETTERDRLTNIIVRKSEEFPKESKLEETKDYFSEASKHVGIRTGHLEGNIAAYQMHKLYSKDVRKILEKNNVPGDLIYLIFGESKFDPTAYSKAGARGVWQLMPATARGEGNLRVTDSIDDRVDVLKSTEGAAKFLKRLIKNFKTEELAVIAYNQGEKNLKKALRYSGGMKNGKIRSDAIARLINFKGRGRFRFHVGSSYLPIFLAAKKSVKNWESVEREVPAGKEYFITIQRSEKLYDVFYNSGLTAMDIIERKGNNFLVAIKESEKNGFLQKYGKLTGVSTDAQVIKKVEKFAAGRENTLLSNYAALAHKQKNIYDSSVINCANERRELVEKARRLEEKLAKEQQRTAAKLNEQKNELAEKKALSEQKALEEQKKLTEQKELTKLEHYITKAIIKHLQKTSANVSPEIRKPTTEKETNYKDPEYPFENIVRGMTFEDLNNNKNINPHPEKYTIDIYNSLGLKIRTEKGTEVKIHNNGTYTMSRKKTFENAARLDSLLESVLDEPLEIEFNNSDCKYEAGPKTKIKLKLKS